MKRYGKPLRFNLSGFIRSNPAEDFEASVQKKDVRLRDLQEFRDHPTLDLPPLRYLKKSGLGSLSQERERGVLPSELLLLSPR